VTSAINRYYDPTTDEFLSIDPDVTTTDQPYVFTNDDPLNAEDPLGDSWWNPFSWTKKDWEVTGGIVLGVVAVATGVGAVGYGLVAVTAAGVDAASTAATTALVLGVVSGTSGAGALGLDLNKCLSGNRTACVGASLGGIGVVTGGLSTVGGSVFAAGSVSSGVYLALSAISASTGVAALEVDGVTVLFKTTTTKSKKTTTDTTKKK
jgi:hypothetical protein